MSILKSRGIEPEIRNYLKDPPSVEELKEISGRLNLRPKDFIRKKEAVFKELGLEKELENDEVLYAALASNPKLLERPIVIRGNSGVLGRPPEKVLDLI